MILTNRFNLPQPFVDAVSQDDYDRGNAEFTTTQLISPVRIDAYKKKFDKERVEDVSERMRRLWGQAKHVVLERIAKTNPDRYMVEVRFYDEMDGATISGRIDLFDTHTKILYDWKDSSVWKFILGDTLEWERQANFNMYLMRRHDYWVKGLINVAMLTDWKARMARVTKKKDYPKCDLHVTKLPMWSVGQQQAFIKERIRVYREEMENPPVCTKQERWERDAQLAVMKKGRKTAIRLLDDHQQAYNMLRWYEEHAKPGEKFFLEERPTEPVRCLDHCPVRTFCDFGIEAIKKWREASETEYKPADGEGYRDQE